MESDGRALNYSGYGEVLNVSDADSANTRKKNMVERIENLINNRSGEPLALWWISGCVDGRRHPV